MLLSKALEIQNGDVVALVGAGGKTTMMFRLADELCAAGMFVVTTTTTHVWAWQAEQNAPALILGNGDDDRARLLDAARDAVRQHGHVFIATKYLESDKLRGVVPELVGELARLADVVIVETDGARGKSFKAPAAHEPVVPLATTILIPIFGLDALGQPLDDAVAFRIEMITRLTGAARGDIITPELVAAVLAHDAGGLKGMPKGARAVPLLNKFDRTQSPLRPAAVEDLARRLLNYVAIDRVLICEVASAEPVRAVWSRVAAVILAAGQARRFGDLKQLAPVGAETMVARTTRIALESEVHEVIVVLGCRAAEILARHSFSPARVAINDDWGRGLSTSVRAGLDAVRADAVIFIPADMPALAPDVINALAQRYRQSRAPIIAPTFRGERGSPVLFNHTMFAKLRALTGDVGGRELLRKQAVATVEVDDAGILMDIDTKGDYEKFSRHSQLDN